MIIIDFTREYVEEVAKLEELCFTWEANSQFALEQYLTSGFGVVALDGETVAGFALCYRGCEEGQIVSVAVLPEFRRRGVGTILMKALTERAKEEKMKTLTLEVRETNAPARKLYESSGFKTVGTRKDFYKNPTENAILMEKTLKSARTK